MTHKDKVLALLSDGKPHVHHEIYKLGVIGHSRIADLRKDGHRIDCWTEVCFGERVSVYQLRLLDETAPSLGCGGVALTRAVSSSEPPNPEGSNGVPDHLPVWDGGPLAIHPDQPALFEAA